MPIDYLSEAKLKEKEVKDLLGEQSGVIGSQLDKTRTNIIAGRKPVIDRLTSYGNNLGISGAIQGGLQERMPGINRKIDSTLARQKLTQDRARQDLIYQNLTQLAESYGLDKQKADQFARQYLSNQKSNEFQSEEAEKDRQLKERQANMADQYAQIGAGQLNASSDQDYTGALLRVLLGTGAAIGTGYAMNKSLTPKTSVPNVGNYNRSNTTYRNLYDNALKSETMTAQNNKLLSRYGIRGNYGS